MVMEIFNFAETTKNMAATEILNYYRNLYYAEPQVTERGIVAKAINDILSNMVEVVRCKDCEKFCEPFCLLNDKQNEWLYNTTPNNFVYLGEENIIRN